MIAAWLVIGVSGTAVHSDDLDYQTAMAGAVRAAASRVLPSVVTIEIVGTAGVGTGEVEQDAPTAGVIIDASGFIIGSSIVVARPAATVLVVLADGSRHAAKVISRDHHRDLVMLKIDTDKVLTPIRFPKQVVHRIGQTTIAVGRYGTGAVPIVSSGVLSATDRLDGIALQTDARVSPAFYGGPLVDLHGNVLGVLIPAVAEGGAENATDWYDSGIAFAVPSEVLVAKLERLREGQDIKKGLIGIVSKSKDPYENETEIAAVRARSPAESAGIKAGDKIIAVEGTPVRRHQEIRQVLGRFDAGEVIRISLQRDGAPLDIELTLAESIPALQPQRLGLIASQRSEGEQTEIVVDAILPGSAAEKHLQAGDVVTRIGETELSEIESVRRLMISAEPDKPLDVHFHRAGSDGKAAITPTSISGPLLAALPAIWATGEGQDWPVEVLKLPDVSNLSALVAPGTAEDLGQLGLLVLLLNPGQGSPEEVAKNWAAAAKQAGVVVLAIAPEDNGRWQPKELEVVARFAAAAMQKAPIDDSAVSVAAAGALTGNKAEAADSMALAVAISQSTTFFGVAVSSDSRPPAVRVRENEPTASLQLLLPVEPAEDLPSWTAPLIAGGYPIVRGGKIDQAKLLQWVRLLQSI
jgi:S1-C subfamily serine protease